ncbi:hypothetical protein NG895_04490 [Aeoliella sp. ICT_H6.2]|uniref:PilZ domain-containing protein n=1 Tax=Aeoliella straminimaris TaxID=2954799 RepID=A0A9X2JHQ4_9BACT|nr:hypothetical protein [Aeoliella straminimaris]MCO6043154.1 hypothetical protein [Aeoliella straminimaris]
MAWIGSGSDVPLCQVPRGLGGEVASLLHRMQPMLHHERRGSTRTSIPYLFELSPQPDEVPELLHQTMVVVGKDVSERGIAFFHQKPIPYRRGVLSIDLPDEGVVQLEVDLLWCRFTSLGWYESGGRLMGVSSGSYPTSQAG